MCIRDRPGLIIDALEGGDGSLLARWAREQVEKGIRTVNMLGCHDGIPMLDLKGLVPDCLLYTSTDPYKAGRFSHYNFLCQSG